MRWTCIFVALLVLPVALLGQGAGHRDAKDRGAPLFDNLGKHHHPITTNSKMAQRYFDQGLILTYAFNHHEAIRSFREAARHDPTCAMAWWGVALAYGPNINAAMTDDVVPKAYEALQKALALAPKASAKEQAYIAALAKRYTDKPVKDRSMLDKAYAEAMGELAQRYPDDLDAATLYAEALMTVTPWDYWTPEGQPKSGTDAVLAALERVLKRDPDHPGANHYYIHAVEASPFPERGLPAAHRLGDVCPGAGHLVHMPSHIFLRVGQYHEASLCNERAIAADESYIAECKVQGFYPAVYYSHNVHFLWYTTSMEGRSADSIRAGRKSAAVLTEKDVHAVPSLQWLKAVPIFALARFGHWDELLREPRPADGALYERAMWHYGRGLAFVRKRQLDDAARELEQLKQIDANPDAKALDMPNFPGAQLIRIAHALLAAEVEGLRGNRAAQVRGLEEAVRLQDALPYMEPPNWYYPVRQSLGAALLEAGQPAKAEAVYREDLRRHPRNGWSLFGLLQCLRAQGKTEEAAEVQKQFQDAWKYADVTLTASRF